MVIAWMKVVAGCEGKRSVKDESKVLHEITRRVSLGRKRRGPRIKPWGTPTFRGCGAESDVSLKIRKKSFQNKDQLNCVKSH